MAELKQDTDGAGGPTRSQLEDRLNQVDAKLQRELRARGFDPNQDNNLALTAPLAKLYTERESLRAELQALNEGPGDEPSDN